MSSDACFICEKHATGDEVLGGVLYDDGHVYAGHTLPVVTEDVSLGYLMVEPRRHVAKLGDLTDDEAGRLMIVANRLAAALRHGIGAEHVYSFIFGDRVPHLHVHLAPRFPETPPELHGLGAVNLQYAAHPHRGGANEALDVCDRLRAHLADEKSQ